MRNRFDRQLEKLNTELIEMGSMCEHAITHAVEAMLKGDAEMARDAIHIDQQIDEQERTIESLCFKLLMQQQPVARDLRQISAALKMITDMERIGDQAGDISEIVQCADVRELAEKFDVAAMAQAAIQMVNESVDAFVKKDLELAHKVIRDDDIVDNHFDRIRADLLVHIQDNGMENALDLLMIAKYLERIGDHATNVAEWVEFSITGIHCSQEKGISGSENHTEL